MIDAKPTEYVPIFGRGFTEEVEESDVEWVRPAPVEYHHSVSDVVLPKRTWPHMPLYPGEAPLVDAQTESVVTITSPKTPSEALSSASTPVHAAAVAMGWETRASRSSTHHTATLFVDASDDHEAGAVRYPAEDREHIWIEARYPTERLGFAAHWTTRKGKTAFTDAMIYDPYGMPVQNWADYEPSSNELKQEKDEPAAAYEARVRRIRDHAARQSYEYNDGSSRTEHTLLITAVKEFTVWLDDWLQAMAPDFLAAREAKKKKKIAAPAEPISEFPDLDLREWKETA